jgi:hypothetical protein
MRRIRELSGVRVFRDPDGAVTGTKGTVCTLCEDGSGPFVEKHWASGDWIFSADYGYQVEKHLYQQCRTRGLPVPELIGCDDVERKLRIEYVEGPTLEPPCDSGRHLRHVLEFFDEFREIPGPPGLDLRPMEGDRMHRCRLSQLRYVFPEEQVWRELDELYEPFLEDVLDCAVPFDGVLKNTFLRDGELVFFDFEWTIAGPYEFTLARAAIEFSRYDDGPIISRVSDMDLYHLFLLRFYMYGREPESVHAYMARHLRDERLRRIFDIVTEHRYAQEPWCDV